MSINTVHRNTRHHSKENSQHPTIPGTRNQQSQTQPKERSTKSPKKQNPKRTTSILTGEYYEISGLNNHNSTIKLRLVKDKQSSEILKFEQSLDYRIENLNLGDVFALTLIKNRDQSLVDSALIFSKKEGDTFKKYIATKVHPLDIDYQLYGLIQFLKDGWYDGVGTAYTKSHLNWVRKLLKSSMPKDLALPAIVPTPEGEIQAEWHRPNLIAILNIDLARKSADCIVARIDGSPDITKLGLELSKEGVFNNVLIEIRDLLLTN
jgi:hypothetical protein